MIFIINSPKYGEKEILIDDEDYDKVSKYNWHLGKNRKNIYVIRNKRDKDKRIVESLHRYLMGHPENKIVDHINGNTLDNRKENLRICTNTENTRNKDRYKNNKIGYKGVLIHKEKKNGIEYQYIIAEIRVNKKKINLGHFKTKELAALAYNQAAIKYFGEFARINKI